MIASETQVLISLFTASSKLVEQNLARVFGVFSVQTVFHAVKSQLVARGAGRFGVLSHVVHALQEVRYLCFASFGIASTTGRSQTDSIKFVHFSTAQGSILVAINQSF